MFKLWDQEILSGFWVLIHILLLKQWIPKLFTKYLRLRVRTFSFRFVWNNIYIFSPSAGPVAFTFNVSVTLSLCYLYHHFFFFFPVLLLPWPSSYLFCFYPYIIHPVFCLYMVLCILPHQACVHLPFLPCSSWTLILLAYLLYYCSKKLALWLNIK